MDCRLIKLPTIADRRGDLTFVEASRHVPFEIRRIFYIYHIGENAERGGHAHKTLHQFVIAAAGRFDVVATDGREEQQFHLKTPDIGLHVPPMTWIRIVGFAPASVPLVLTSDYYDEADYYRDFEIFRAAVAKP